MCYQHVWVDLGIRQALDALQKEAGRQVQCITDVRFPNECAAIRSILGVLGLVVRVNRPDALPAGGEVHESEAHALTMQVDYEIDNSGNLHETRLQVWAFLKNLGYET